MAQQLSAHPLRFLIAEDHEAVVVGITPALQARYPAAELTIVKTVRAVEESIAEQLPDLIITDLTLPAEEQTIPSIKAGLTLLQRLIDHELAPSLLVFSTHIRSLIRLKASINTYRGGFVARSKSTPVENIIEAVGIALKGSIDLPPDVRSRSEFDPRWLQVLALKYEEGLSDKAIAQIMGISDRTVRNYWTRIQDALGVFDSTQQDLKVQIQIAAKKAGLIE
ncbi:MAG: response regulator transcription factor [Cyanobacteria bacterium J06581_3]